MLKSLRIKHLAVDLGWIHNMFDYMGFYLHQVTTWKNKYTIETVMKYASIKIIE